MVMTRTRLLYLTFVCFIFSLWNWWTPAVCLILNLELLKTKLRKREKKQVSQRIPTPLCWYLQCVRLDPSWRESMQLKHTPEKRLPSVIVTLENQLETLYKSLLVLQLIQHSWDWWFTAATTSPCSNHNMAEEERRVKAQTRASGGLVRNGSPPYKAPTMNPREQLVQRWLWTPKVSSWSL